MGRKLKRAIYARELAHHLSLEALGTDLLVTSVEEVGQKCGNGLCFAKSNEWVLRADPNCLLITTPQWSKDRQGPSLISNEPRLDFAKALVYLERKVGFVWSTAEPNIHPTAVIGKHAVIGKGVIIGENTVIGHHVVIGDEVKIGKNCIVKSCAVLGEDGFGFERQSNGNSVRLPHIGNVVIHDNVEIGALTTVCRGTLGDTIIADGAKIDDHVHIAHNVHIGRGAFIIACAEVSGGVKIGERAWIAPNASVMNQLSIGDDSVVGLGSVVIKDVHHGIVVAGNPAKALRK